MVLSPALFPSAPSLKASTRYMITSKPLAESPLPSGVISIFFVTTVVTIYKSVCVSAHAIFILLLFVWGFKMYFFL